MTNQSTPPAERTYCRFCGALSDWCQREAVGGSKCCFACDHVRATPPADVPRCRYGCEAAPLPDCPVHGVLCARIVHYGAESGPCGKTKGYFIHEPAGMCGLMRGCVEEVPHSYDMHHTFVPPDHPADQPIESAPAEPPVTIPKYSGDPAKDTKAAKSTLAESVAQPEPPVFLSAAERCAQTFVCLSCGETATNTDAFEFCAEADIKSVAELAALRSELTAARQHHEQCFADFDDGSDLPVVDRPCCRRYGKEQRERAEKAERDLAAAARYREALERIANMPALKPWNSRYEDCVFIAREALQAEKED